MRCMRLFPTFHCSSDRSVPWCKPASISYATECCWDSLSPNDIFWSVRHVCFIHEVKSGHCSQVLLLLNHSLHFFFLCNLNLTSFLHCCANPAEVAPPPPPLPPRAGFNRHVCRLRHEVACCPESATSHAISLSCTFKKLYLKKNIFNLAFLSKFGSHTGEFLSLNITAWLRVTNIHVYRNILKSNLLKTAWVDKNTCCTI